MRGYEHSLPAGWKFAFPFDNTRFIRISIEEVVKTLKARAVSWADLHQEAEQQKRLAAESAVSPSRWWPWPWSPLWRLRLSRLTW